MTVFRAAVLTAALAAALPAAPNYMPLSTGNEWVYRDTASGQTFNIRVGLGLVHNANVYYKVTGYASGPMFLRNGDDGGLYYLDQDNDQEFLLTSFDPVEKGWYDTVLSGCAQGYQPQAKSVEYRGPNSYFASALEMLYRSYSCADTGIEREVYVANVGLVQRSVTTIAGPRTWELVHARVGSLVFLGQPNTSFRVSLDRTRIEPSPGESAQLRVAMRLSVHYSPGLTLQFASPQRYDVQVRNAAGEVIWRCCNGVAYSQVIEEVSVSGDMEFVHWIPVDTQHGGALAAGEYTVEARLNTVGREFAAATKFAVLPQD